MPYISQGKKAEFETKCKLSEFLNNLTQIDLVAGDLNFLFTKISIVYLKKLSYARINDVIGALTCCGHELYRRVAGSYEDIKRKENGDVF